MSVFTPLSIIEAPKLPGTLFHLSKTYILQSMVFSNLLASVLRFIFEQSLLTGDLPTDCTRANVAAVFKKGSKLQAVNYRPVSLTCITCKLFKHIICRHVLDHLEKHKILTELYNMALDQGDRLKLNLLLLFRTLLNRMTKKGSQTDILTF